MEELKEEAKNRKKNRAIQEGIRINTAEKKISTLINKKGIMSLGDRIELRKQELEYQEAQREKNKRICEKNGFLYAKHGEVLSKIFFRQLAAKQALTKTMEDTKGRILNKPAEIRKELNQIYKNIFNQEDNYREGDIERFLGEKRPKQTR